MEIFWPQFMEQKEMDNSTAREREKERENINFTQYLSNIVWTWAQCRVTGEESIEWGVVQQEQQQCVASFIYLFLFFPFLFFSMFSSSSPQLRSILFVVVVFSTHLSHLQF